MRMSVTPQEIAKHLVEEMGHQEAVAAYEYHLSRCIDDETASVWSNIGQALKTMQPIPLTN